MRQFSNFIDVRKLEAKGNEEKLHVTAMLKCSVPFSCVIDGIQVAIKCTIWNKKLKLRNSSGIAARFELAKKQVTIIVNPTEFSRLKHSLLAENVPPEEVRQLAQLVASIPEEELFIIRRR